MTKAAETLKKLDARMNEDEEMMSDMMGASAESRKRAAKKHAAAQKRHEADRAKIVSLALSMTEEDFYAAVDEADLPLECYEYRDWIEA